MLILSFAKIGAWPHVWEPLASRGNPMLPKTDKTLSGEKDIRSLMHHCCNALKWLLVQWQQKQWSLIRCIVCPYCACCWCALNTKLHTVEKRVEIRSGEECWSSREQCCSWMATATATSVTCFSCTAVQSTVFQQQRIGVQAVKPQSAVWGEAFCNLRPVWLWQKCILTPTNQHLSWALSFSTRLLFFSFDSVFFLFPKFWNCTGLLFSNFPFWIWQLFTNMFIY